MKSALAKTVQASAFGGSAEACFLPYKEFYEIGLQEPMIMMGLMELLGKLVEQAEMRLSHLSDHQLKSRVVSALLYLDDKFGQKTLNGSRIGVNIDRATLSQLAGTVRESTSRVLTELEADQLISRIGRHIFIRDKARLLKLIS
ncbi:MAG: Crp/Fnr family transcriptional regulator [Bdellovibrionales bacterium]